MSKVVYYRQCQLQKGHAFQTSWLPEPFAAQGRVLRLRDADGTWDNGWVVIRVGSSRREEAQLPDSHQEIRRHRKATGDALPRTV
jgi:hypothetical protein